MEDKLGAAESQLAEATHEESQESEGDRLLDPAMPELTALDVISYVSNIVTHKTCLSILLCWSGYAFCDRKSPNIYSME